MIDEILKAEEQLTNMESVIEKMSLLSCEIETEIEDGKDIQKIKLLNDMIFDYIQTLREDYKSLNEVNNKMYSMAKKDS